MAFSDAKMVEALGIVAEANGETLKEASEEILITI